MGSGITYNPHVVHICRLEEGVHLLLMFEVNGNILLQTFVEYNLAC
jgi:hypothetical protein